MTHSHAALLLALSLASCKDVTGPTWANSPPPIHVSGVYLPFSKVVLPANISFQVSVWVQYTSGWGACGSWTSGDSTVASFAVDSGNGNCPTYAVLKTLKAGTVALIASFDSVADTAIVTVLPTLRVASVAASGGSLVGSGCVLDQAGAAYCWWPNSDWRLGPDTATDDCGDACVGIPRPVAGGLVFKTIAVGPFRACGATGTGDVYCWGEGYGYMDGGRPPSKVAASVAITTLTMGSSHACGLTTDGSAYCWGVDFEGELGDGARQNSDVPVPVGGGLHFASISAGATHTCALTMGGVAYCWGLNSSGQLGNGDTLSRDLPTPISGTVTFASLSVGSGHTCGLTTDGATYCWGANDLGQLGFDTKGAAICAQQSWPVGSTGECSTVPVAVSGNAKFGRIDAKGYNTCGITQFGQAYCWGGMYLSGSCAGPARADGPGGWVLGGVGFCFPQPKGVITPELLPGTTQFSTRNGRGGCWMSLDGAAYCWNGYRNVAPQHVPGQQL